MRIFKELGRRAAVSLLALTMTFATVPPVGARDAILGTITVRGPAFAATSTADWAKISDVRPLVSGDRLRTDPGGSLVADFGELGIVGLYGDSELSVRAEKGKDVVIDAQRGKVAFQLPAGSRLMLTARGAQIAAGTLVAVGYVELGEDGPPQVVAESDGLNVVLAGGTTKTLARGERLALAGGSGEAASQVVTSDERKAGAVETTAAPQPRKKWGGLSPLGWTAIAGVVAAVGIGVGVGVSGGGGGGGGDSNGSE